MYRGRQSTDERQARTLEPVVVAGAGALGSVYGGLLAASGLEVVLLTRGTHEAALRRNHLELRIQGSVRRVRVKVSARASARTLILTSRLFDTQAVLARVDGAPAVAISLQNGLEKNAALVKRFGPDAVAPAVSMVAAELIAPGVVESAGLGKTLIGASHPLAVQLVRMLDGVGAPSELVEDGSSAEWSKLAAVAATMGLQAVSRRFLHELMLDEDSAILLARMCAEISALAEANGETLGDWPGLLPVRTLAAFPPKEAVARAHALGEAMVAQGATQRRTSLLRAAEAGHRTELDGIHGALVRRGEAAGVDLPTVEACLRLARLCGVAD